MGMERSKLVDKNAYVRWYNLAREEVKDNNLIPERTKEQIFNLVSRENWLLFCLNGEDKDDAIIKAEPNVFFDVLSKEGNLTGFGRLGLTFNNLKSYDKFKTIMRGINKELKNKITKELLSLKHSWFIKLNRKVKKYNYAQTPEYHEEGKWNSNNINEVIVDEVIKKANAIRQQGIKHRDDIRLKAGNPKKFYTETPTINLMEEEFKLNEEEFKDRVLEIFNILALCLKVKSNVEANKLIREKLKILKNKQVELNSIKDTLPKLERMIGVTSQITEEGIKKKRVEKIFLEKEIERLNNEIEEQ